MELEFHQHIFDLNISQFSFIINQNSSDYRIISQMAPGMPQPSDQIPTAMDGGDCKTTTTTTNGDPPSSMTRCPSNAAMRVQKVYRSYRTRRMLADSAVVAEELWWQAIDFARLNHSTKSFYTLKPESAASRWNRVGHNASKVGKGLSKDGKAQKLAFQHWIEAIDPRHRYGHNLHVYYEEWCKSNAGQPFFFWLDLGDGKDIDLKECPRSKLREQCIKYLGPQERDHYEYVVVDGRLLNKLTGKPLDTSQGSKWIFVMSTSHKLYSGEKKKGLFHHSSFLAGGATLAAGRFTAEDGVLKGISAYSGHYKPTDDRLDTFLSFLRENGVNLDEVEIKKASDDGETKENGKLDEENGLVPEATEIKENGELAEEKDLSPKATDAIKSETKNEYKRTLSGGLQSPKADVPKMALLDRINSKKNVNSYQIGHQLSSRWSTGAGPRLGIVRDYPMELRLQALELTNLSPRPRAPKSNLMTRRSAALLSPTVSASNLGNAAQTERA